MTITSFKDKKSTKVTKLQIDGKDRSIHMLATEKSKLSMHQVQRRAMQIIAETYLPKDFPDSVSKEFLPFTIYSLIGGTSAAAMLFLST